MKKLFLACTLGFAIVASAQQNPLIKVGNQEISKEEFLSVYNKNKDIGKDIDPKTPHEYLDLFINFKLKVEDALRAGLDTMPSFKREFETYRNQLAKPYLTEKKVNEQLVEEAYERMKMEVNASHIMKDLAVDATPEDTLRVYKELLELRRRVLDGEISFEELAREHSTDTYSAKKGGNLGYFTVFNMVYPFETVAYTINPGEISMPFCTQFGYHIVKVINKRKASGEVEVAHIFLRHNKKNVETNRAPSERIEEIHQMLMDGGNFEEMAKQFSEDQSNASNGGKVKPFGINEMLPEFEAVAFSMEETGSISKPFATEAGWHIIKFYNKTGVSDFEEVKGVLREKVKRDSRSNKSNEAFLARLRSEYNLKENKRNLKKVLKTVGPEILDGDYLPPTGKKYRKTLFSFDGVDVSMAEFMSYLELNQMRGRKTSTPEEEAMKHYENYINQRLHDYEDSRLEEKYPEFKALVNEYRDGILLFTITEEKVWKKAANDSTGLENYYERNSENHRWPDQVRAAIYNVKDKKMADRVARDLKRGKTAEEIMEEYGTGSGLNIVFNYELYTKKTEPLLAEFEWKEGVFGPYKFEGERYKVIEVEEVIPSYTKAFDDVKGIMISGYQKELEEKWLKELKAKYEVKVDTAAFENLVKDLD